MLPNNGMHPTPLHEVSHEACVGARVMPGVRLLILLGRVYAACRRRGTKCVACV